MNNIKLLKLLSKLSKQEFLSLGFYLKTPSFNKNKELISLYEALKFFAPNFIAKKIIPEDIFNQVYPKKKFSNIKLNHLCSLLTLSTQNFLASIQLRKEEYIKERLLLKRYDNKKFTDDFMVESKNFTNHLDKKRPLDLAGHYHDFWLQRSLYYHTGNVTRYPKVGKTILVNAFNNLEEFYKIARLELICEMANREKMKIDVYNKQYYNLNFTNKAQDILNEKEVESIQDLYLILFRILTNQQGIEFIQKVKIISDYTSKFKINKFEKSIIRNYLINTISELMIDNPKIGLNAYFELLYGYLKSGEFTHGGYINAPNMLNVCIAGIETGRTKEVYFIVSNFGHKIIKQKKENTLKLINAMLALANNKYNKCIHIMNTINDREFEIKINLELLYIRTYFRLIISDSQNVDKLLFTNIKRYKKYINQSKTISQNLNESNSNFLEITTSLYHLYKKKDHSYISELERTKIRIKNTKTPLKLWLYSQIDEMIKMN